MSDYNRAQLTIIEFLTRYYPAAAFEIISPVDVAATLPTGDRYTLGINLRGDIIEGDSNIIAEAVAAPDTGAAGYVMPLDWTCVKRL
jgi:hypothetical protein